MVYRSTSRIVFQICNYTFFLLFSVSILVPFIHAVSISFSSYAEVAQGNIGLWPKGWNTDAYVRLMANMSFLRSFGNSVMLTVVNTVLVILFSLCAGFALAHKHMVGRKVVFTYILITMFFNGGLIPTYLVVNALGLTNTYFALIFPSVCNVFYIIIFKNVIDQMPKDLLEAAEMDGAGEISTLFRVVLPLVLPMTAAFTVFSAVAYWNEWFNVLIYIRKDALWTLQFHLRSILNDTISVNTIMLDAMIKGQDRIHPQNVKMAALMITVLPIVMIYPFVQKYFIHGQFVGAVKG